MKFSTSSAHTCFDYLFHVPRSPFVISRQLLGQLFPVLYRAERLYSNMKYLSVPNSFFISFFLFLSIIPFKKLLFIEIFPSIEVKMENNICNKNEQKYITKKKEKSRIIIHFQTLPIFRLYDPKTLSKKTVEPGWFNRFAGSLREIEENEERETVGWYAANR